MGYQTLNKEGFIDTEIQELLVDFPNLNRGFFDNALYGSTCIMRDGKLIIYHVDVINAIMCGLEWRHLTDEEFD